MDPNQAGDPTPASDGDKQNPPPEAPGLNFWAVFESAPDAYLLLAPDAPHFTMVAANDARLRGTMTRPEDVIGRPLFEVFPDNATDTGATGVRNLQASLDEVLRTGRSHRMALQNYDIRTLEGEFEDRYWDPLNSPVLDEHGNLIYIIHRVEGWDRTGSLGQPLECPRIGGDHGERRSVVAEPESLAGVGRRIIYVNEAFTRMTPAPADPESGTTASRGPRTRTRPRRVARAGPAHDLPLSLTSPDRAATCSEYERTAAESPPPDGPAPPPIRER